LKESLMRWFVSLWAMSLAMLCAGAQAQSLRPVTVTSGLEHPWGLAFLPEGQMLVTERPGRLRLVSKDGRLGEPIAGVPEVDARRQGGLLDVVLDPKFADNRLIYLSYSEPGADDKGRAGNSTAVARAKLDGQRLVDLKVIFRQQPKVSSSAHFGSRLVFARDGRLFITLGDRYSRRDDAQTLDTHHGKVVRINADGSVPADNPYVQRAGALPEIWTIGHRNIQGAALHPLTGELWSHEHGPQGGDELNIELPGRNYGWPVITTGREYVTGLKIGDGTTRADVEPALKTWVPSIAPNGMAFLTSDRYPGWKGNLFIGALSGQALVRLELDGRKVVSEERLLQSLGERIRDVRQGPDGWLYLLTDNDNGRILRIER
jgi:glucose/arabinose dehydrogenase